MTGHPYGLRGAVTAESPDAHPETPGRQGTAADGPHDAKVAARFWAKVSRGHPSECWEWLGCLADPGYGRLSIDGKLRGAHRVSWELTRGPIPDGFQIDHRCFNTACVNPDHLEPVTPKVNSSRSSAGDLSAIRYLAITHCPAGHPYDAENTTHWVGGARRCLACGRARAAERRRADPEAARQRLRDWRAKVTAAKAAGTWRSRAERVGDPR